jgi:hypothetical protein
LFSDEQEKRYASAFMEFLNAVSTEQTQSIRVRESVLVFDESSQSILLQYHPHIYTWMPVEKKILEAAGVPLLENMLLIDINRRLIPDASTLNKDEDEQIDMLTYMPTYLYKIDAKLASQIALSDTKWFPLADIDKEFSKDYRLDSAIRRLLEKLHSMM